MCLSEIGPHPEGLTKDQALVWYWKPLLVNSSSDPYLSKFGVSPRYSSAKDVSKKVFGTTDKRVTKIVMNHSDLALLLSFSLDFKTISNHYGIDSAIEILKRRYSTNEYDSLSQYRDYLQYFPLNAFRKFSEEGKVPVYLFPDSLKSMRIIVNAGQSFDDFSGNAYDIHNRLFLEARKISEKPVNFTYEDKWFRAVDNGFLLPENSTDLIQWSHEFENCSSSYKDDILDCRTTVLKHPETKTMIEVKRSGIITQILKKHNKDVSIDEFSTIVKLLQDLGLSNNNTAESLYCVWGKPKELTREEIQKMFF